MDNIFSCYNNVTVAEQNDALRRCFLLACFHRVRRPFCPSTPVEIYRVIIYCVTYRISKTLSSSRCFISRASLSRPSKKRKKKKNSFPFQKFSEFVSSSPRQESKNGRVEKFTFDFFPFPDSRDIQPDRSILPVSVHLHVGRERAFIPLQAAGSQG